MLSINNNYISKWPALGRVVECSPMVRETGVQFQVELFGITQNVVLDNSLLNTQHNKVRFKGKVDQFREGSCALPYTLV